MLLVIGFFILGAVFGLALSVVGLVVMTAVALGAFAFFASGSWLTGSLVLDLVIAGIACQVGYGATIAVRARRERGHRKVSEDTVAPAKEASATSSER